MPSVVVMPTFLPAVFMMWAIMREVVVLPLVPVTATIGTRDGLPGGKSMSITARPTWRGCPSVGWVCMRKPGPALTSTIAPRCSRTERAMSAVMKSMPATSSPTTIAAWRAISTLSGWISSVRSIEVPPVLMLPVSLSWTKRPSSGTSSSVKPLLRQHLDRLRVDGDAGQDLLVPDAAARIRHW